MRHIGLNVLYLVPGQGGGSEVYARSLIPALGRARPEVCFTAFAAREAAPVLRGEDWPAAPGPKNEKSGQRAHFFRPNR